MNKYSLLERISNHLILNSSFLLPISLMNGKIGAAVFFYRLFGNTNTAVYEDVANDLIDSAITGLNVALPTNYSYGLTGLGCGLEYLMKNLYIEGDPEALEALDEAVFMLDRTKFKHDKLYLDFYFPGMYFVARTDSGIKEWNEKAVNYINWDLSQIALNDKVAGSFIISLAGLLRSDKKCLFPALEIIVSELFNKNQQNLSTVEQFLVRNLGKDVESIGVTDRNSVHKSISELNFHQCLDASYLLFGLEIAFDDPVLGLLKNELKEKLNNSDFAFDELFANADFGKNHLLGLGNLLL